MNISSKKENNISNFFFYAILSLYIVFVQGTDMSAITLDRQVFRHHSMLEGNSEFFNPWQYRILSTYFVEIFHRILHFFNSSIDYVKSFLIFRFLQAMGLFYLTRYLYQLYGVKNHLLLHAGTIILGLTMANSVYHSDLSISTYFDVLFYVLSAILIIKKQYVWIIPVTALGVLNRETSAFIPLMLIVSTIDWQRRSLDKSILIISILSCLTFAAGFVGVRLYYGFRPPEIIADKSLYSIIDYLRYNFTFLRSYPLLVGTLTFIPVIIIMYFKQLPLLMRQWFWLIVPAWFLIHYSYALVSESRLFLVPHTLIFIPAFLWLIENRYTEMSMEKSQDR